MSNEMTAYPRCWPGVGSTLLSISFSFRIRLFYRVRQLNPSAWFSPTFVNVLPDDSTSVECVKAFGQVSAAVDYRACGNLDEFRFSCHYISSL